jgi:hypothetical protein
LRVVNGRVQLAPRQEEQGNKGREGKRAGARAGLR